MSRLQYSTDDRVAMNAIDASEVLRNENIGKRTKRRIVGDEC